MAVVRVVRQACVAAALVTGLAMGGVVVVEGASAAAASPHLVVTPSTGLVKGETVTVSGSKFKPKETIYIVECLATVTVATGTTQCNLAGTVGVTTSSSGVLAKTKFKVLTGKIGTVKATCGTTRSNLRACEVSAGTAAGTDSVSVIVQFKLP